MAQFVAVLPLSPLDVGDGFSVSSWPLHVTVAINFSTDGDADGVGRALALAANGFAPLDVVVGAEAMFGPEKNVPVSLVEHSPELAALHAALVAAILQLGGRFDTPEFVGNGYRPHVTATRHASASAGERLYLVQLALVDMRPCGDAGVRRVVWTAPLG